MQNDSKAIAPFSVSPDQEYIFALHVAEQGGLFSAIDFKRRYPDAAAYAARKNGEKSQN